MDVKLKNKKVRLFKIDSDGDETFMISGHFSFHPVPEIRKDEFAHRWGLGQMAWCGSLNGAYLQTSIIQEIVEDTNEKFRFKTLNSVYEARALPMEDCRG